MRNIFFILCVFFIQTCTAYHTISADTLSKWISSGPPFSFILVDVRDTSEVDTVMGTAVCRPYHMSLNQGVFAGNYSLIPKTSTVILYCRSGNRSGQAAATLDAAGHTSVYAMSSGFSTWKGPKQPRNMVRPLSDLPENSMAAVSSVFAVKSAAIKNTAALSGISHHIADNRYMIARVNPQNGSILYLNAVGRITGRLR